LATKKIKKGTIVAGPDFGRRNYIILAIGVFLIVAGFLFLAMGDITISPILLVIGYCVIIPIGILLPEHKDEAPVVAVEKDIAASGRA
jgi:xanthine/uracil permease